MLSPIEKELQKTVKQQIVVDWICSFCLIKDCDYFRLYGRCKNNSYSCPASPLIQ